MPFYEYECETHGSFEELRTVDECSEPMGCPNCGKDAIRIFSVPNTRILSHSTRAAMDRNLASQHEPRVCSSGCRPKQKVKPGQKPKPISYTGPRPWVIEHA